MQYLRKCSLIVAGMDQGLDLSGLRIRFSVKRSDAQTPNAAEIRVYNLAPNTARQIRDEFTRVILQAGYEENFGVIFDGDIKQVKFGREGGTDTYVDIAAGDGDAAYNFAVVNTTLAAGARQSDQIRAALAPMAERGVTAGYIDTTDDRALPRGKAMFGMSRDYLRRSADTTATTWSIQDRKVQFVKRTGLLPGQAVALGSATGLVGVPEVTNEGVYIRSLLNPLLVIGGQVQVSGSTDADGIYRILVVEHTGDTHGNEWYSTITGLLVDPSAPKGQQVAPT